MRILSASSQAALAKALGRTLVAWVQVLRPARVATDYGESAVLPGSGPSAQVRLAPLKAEDYTADIDRREYLAYRAAFPAGTDIRAGDTLRAVGGDFVVHAIEEDPTGSSPVSHAIVSRKRA